MSCRWACSGVRYLCTFGNIVGAQFIGAPPIYRPEQGAEALSAYYRRTIYWRIADLSAWVRYQRTFAGNSMVGMSFGTWADKSAVGAINRPLHRVSVVNV